MLHVRRRSHLPHLRLLGVLLLSILIANADFGEALAATCTVTTLADGGNPGPTGSLRQKLNDSSCSTIVFQAGLTGTITLSRELPMVTRTVTVAGPGASALTIDRNDQLYASAFEVGPGGNMTLDGMTVTNSYDGIYLKVGDGGTTSVTVRNSVISAMVHGVMFFGGGSATVSNTLFDDNHTGMEFYNGGSAIVTNVAFTNNRGDGISFSHGGSAIVTDSLFSKSFGGVSFEEGGSAVVTNVTFDQNYSGIRIAISGTATVTNATFSQNKYGLEFSAGGTATLTNSLLAKGQYENCAIGSSGVFTNGGHNLADDASCVGTTSTKSLGLDPAGPANNGGPTKTIALAASSPAVNAGDDTVCAQAGAGKVNGEDQRGYPRPAGAHCDIGAYELGAIAPPTCGQMFTDVAASNPACQAIEGLAARGVINGCFTDPVTHAKDFCPTESTLRHQMAALIVRAIPAWVGETGLPTFGDNTDDAELMTRVATLQRHGVVRGYQTAVCLERNIQTPPGCYGPLDTVKYGQVMLFIARAMEKAGYWTLQPDDRTIFPDQNGAVGAPADDQQTLDHRYVVTYVHYVGNPPDVVDVHANFALLSGQGWPDASTRAWFTRAFWPAIRGH